VHEVVFQVAVVWLGVLAAVTIALAARARSLLSRVLALDTLTLLLVAGLVVVAVARRSVAYLDAALVLALLSFVGTVAAARYHGGRGLFR
jgi:multisubunit Na+/H+ antiporter MnhF subunit